MGKFYTDCRLRVAPAGHREISCRNSTGRSLTPAPDGPILVFAEIPFYSSIFVIYRSFSSIFPKMLRNFSKNSVFLPSKRTLPCSWWRVGCVRPRNRSSICKIPISIFFPEKFEPVEFLPIFAVFSFQLSFVFDAPQSGNERFRNWFFMIFKLSFLRKPKIFT